MENENIQRLDREREHLSYIDRARGFAMCCVVIGHIITLVSMSKPEMRLGEIVRVLSVFELTVFFVISGYLFYKNPQPLFFPFVKKRFFRLLIPYFIFSLLNILFFVLIEHSQDMNLSNLLMLTFTFYGISVLWFFPTLFIGEILWWFLQKKLKPCSRIIVLFVIIVVACSIREYLIPTAVSLWAKSQVLYVFDQILIAFLRGVICMFFIGVGYGFGSAEEKWREHKLWSVIMWFMPLIGLCSAWYVPSVNLKDYVFQRPALWIASAMMISIGILFLAQQTKSISLNILDVIGKNSMIVMCTHLDFKIPIYCMMCAEQFVAISPHGKNYVYWGSLFASLVMIEVLVVWVWNIVKGFLGTRTESYSRVKKTKTRR